MKKIFEKKFLGEKFQMRDRGPQNFFPQKLEKMCLTIILRPKWLNLGAK